MLKILSYICLLLIAPATMADIFQPVIDDRSIALLGSFFGPSVGSEVLNGLYQPVLSQVLYSFNWIIITFGTIVAGYVSMVSVSNTAQEGSAMGEKWSAVWVPVRSVVGLGLMIPTPSTGYSSIQSFVMWVVVNGVGAADILWTTVLTSLANGATLAANSSANINSNSQIMTAASNLSQDILLANTCIAALKQLAAMQPPQANQKVQQALYEEIHGTADNPINNTPLLQYGSSLTAYIDPNSKITNTSSTSSYSKSANLNFGAPNISGNSAWSNICGTVNISVSIKPSDYPNNAISQLSTDQENDLDRVFDAALGGIQGMSSLYSILANDLVTNNVAPQTTTTAPNSNPTYTFLQSNAARTQLAPQGYILLAEQSYAQSMLTGTVPLAQDNPIQTTIEQGLLQGWLTAGSFYFILSQSFGNQALFSALNGQNPVGTFTTHPPHCDGSTSTANSCIQQVYAPDSTNNVDTSNVDDPNSPTAVSNALGSGTLAQGFVTMYLAQANVYSNIDQPNVTQQLIDPTINSPQQLQAVPSALNPMPAAGGNVGIINTTIGIIGNGDVIVGLSKYGYDLMISAESYLTTIYAVLGVVALGVGASALEFPIPFLDSFEFLGAEEGWKFMSNLILSMVLLLFSILWTFGAGLNMYLPMIPYMIFVVAAIGWGILVLEAIIAAPIFALSLVTPNGDELGTAEEGLGILASIGLRPALMVIGFLFAGKIYEAIIVIVNTGIVDTYSMIGAGGSSGNGQGTTFSWIAALSIYVSFVVSLANKCFSFIYILPDQIMRWLGSNRESSPGAQQELSEAKQGSEHANKAIYATSSGAAQFAGKTLDRWAQHVDARNAKNARQEEEAKASAATAASAAAAAANPAAAAANAAATNATNTANTANTAPRNANPSVPLGPSSPIVSPPSISYPLPGAGAAGTAPGGPSVSPTDGVAAAGPTQTDVGTGSSGPTQTDVGTGSSGQTSTDVGTGSSGQTSTDGGTGSSGQTSTDGGGGGS
jgi:defect-in-organelle-trafficking protein DotA